MIRAYDKDNMTFITYDWGYVAKKDEIEFNTDTRIVESNSIIEDCEALIILNDTKSNTSLLLGAKSVEEASKRMEEAVKNGYLIFTLEENPIEVYTDTFNLIEKQ